MGTKLKRISCGLLVHDGRNWSLYNPSEDVPLVTRTGRVDDLPEEILQALEPFVSVRILVSGEATRLDLVLPRRLAYAKARERILAAAAELTGRESSELIPVPGTSSWYGCRAKFLLTALLDRVQIDTVEDVLAESGVASAGWGSLEFALLAAWLQANEDRTATLLVVGEAFTFDLPAQKRGNPGPHSFSGGLRHFAADAENWIGRLRRGLKDEGGDLHLRVLPLSAASVAADVVLALQKAGFADVSLVNGEPLLRSARTLALKANANRLDALVPIVNPHVPRKRFSHAWIVVPCLLILALPFVGGYCWHARCVSREQACQFSGRAYLPLQDRIQKARTARDAASRAAQSRKQFLSEVLARREPLNDFINMAYFFSKHAGSTVVLEKLEEHGSNVTVTGLCGDPEDGVRMNDALGRFLAEKGMRLVSNDVKDVPTGEGRSVSRFQIVVTSGGAR